MGKNPLKIGMCESAKTQSSLCLWLHLRNHGCNTEPVDFPETQVYNLYWCYVGLDQVQSIWTAYIKYAIDPT